MGDPGQLDFSFAPPARRTWSVRDLVAAVRTHVEREYGDVWVEGEISNYRPSEAGHLYFTLKDDAAQVRVVMFRAQARLLRFCPENGLQVIVRGRITLYEARGEMQLSAEYMEPKGAGALQIAFEQLKARLQAEGLFDASRKKPLPRLPRRIGIVTSPRGAAVRDILNVLWRRHESVGVLIYPAQVQGEAAAAEVSAGVRYFNRAKYVDVIMIARGGGSLEDLAAFNDETLARTIAESLIPVISAVGHETDFTICDFVSDLRAPTPSAAAELVVESKHQLEEQVATLSRRLGNAARMELLTARNRLTELAQHGAFERMQQLLQRREQRLDDLRQRLMQAEREDLRAHRRRLDVAVEGLRHQDVSRVLDRLRERLDARQAALVSAERTLLLRRSGRLDQLSGRLEALSPLNILERGYAVVFDEQGRVIKDAAQTAPGKVITARVARGRIEAEVKKTRP